MRYFKIFEIAYLVIAILATIEAVRMWPIDRSRSYIMILFAVVSIGMFFFRRYYRKKFGNRSK
ncbi:hypothetical protein [Galbibacter marinus]|uniref:hypothetical protein n=1 Tax=Galbibacter marinus TaxID=555500 RepID=UPI0002F5D340|nr:hypothetical protein [Galbibacter marinus]